MEYCEAVSTPWLRKLERFCALFPLIKIHITTFQPYVERRYIKSSMGVLDK